MRSLLDEVSVAPFLAERRLVVVDGVPRFEKEEVALLEANLHPQTLLVFVDPSPDKRLGGVKALMELAEVKTFPPLKGRQLEEWMMKTAQRFGSTLEAAASALLLREVGEDQDVLEQEIAKLATHAAGKPITRLDVEELTVPVIDSVLWTITDLLAAGRKPDALRYARRILAKGGDAFGVWAILLNMLRNASAIAAAQDARVPDASIAKEAGIHPFAARSIQPYARRAGLPAIAAFAERVVMDDIALKTGGYRATDEWPQEILALVDRFIMTCP
jgi:DNA polymerase III delta subunit